MYTPTKVTDTAIQEPEKLKSLFAWNEIGQHPHRCLRLCPTPSVRRGEPSWGRPRATLAPPPTRTERPLPQMHRRQYFKNRHHLKWSCHGTCCPRKIQEYLSRSAWLLLSSGENIEEPGDDNCRHIIWLGLESTTET